MHWYYLSERKERVPVTDSQLAPLAAGGIVRPTTLVWREGLANWAVAGELRPDLFAPTARSASQSLALADPATVTAARALGHYAPWMGVFSAVMIVSGAVALALTAALGTGWLLNMSWFREMMRQVTPDGDVPSVHAWSMLAIGTLYAVSLLLPGSMLAVASRQVKLASLRGSSPVLEASLRNLGRFFQTWIIAALLITLLSGIWTLYSWRHRALPKPPDPTTQRVAI